MTDLERWAASLRPDELEELRILKREIDLKRWAEEFRDVYKIAEALCRTPFVPAAMLGKQADVAAAIMKGRELGLDPFDALDNIYVVHGRVGYYADFMRRRIIQAGHQFKIVETTDSRCIVEGTRKDTGETHRATFTSEAARKAGIDLGKYPADKLIARATSRLCKQAFPDVLSGSLIAEDLIDGVIPTDDTTPPAAVEGPPVQRKRPTKPAKAARTQPKPATPATEPDTDIAELLGDTPDATAGAFPEGVRATPMPTQTSPAGQDGGEAPPAGEPQLPLDQPELITPAQLKKLHTLLRKEGLDERQAGLDWLSAATGRDITSSKLLTLHEASDVIDVLEEAQQEDEEGDK